MEGSIPKHLSPWEYLECWHLCFFKHRSHGSSRVVFHCEVGQFSDPSFLFLYLFFPPFPSTPSQVQCLVFSLLIKSYPRKIFSHLYLSVKKIFRCFLSQRLVLSPPYGGEQSHCQRSCRQQVKIFLRNPREDFLELLKTQY